MSVRDLDLIHLQTCLDICSPILRKPAVDPHILERCADVASMGCETVRSLCLEPGHQATLTYAFLTFTFGITLLRCLVVAPGILPLSRILRGVSACGSSLAVYTRTLSLSIPLLQTFDMLSDRYFAIAESSSGPDEDFCMVLHRVSLSSPEGLHE